LQNRLQQIIKEAMEISNIEFVKTVERATRLLQKENGRIGIFRILGRHVKIKPCGEAVVISDLHGDLESLVQILQESNILLRMENSKLVSLIFLGDYGDRGEFSAEVYSVILKLKLQYPEQTVLMRGNHEGPKDLMASPHDLPTQFRSRFGEKWIEPYEKILELFPHLYNSVSVEGRYLMVHGGLPREARTIKDFAYAHETYPENTFLEDILWSDPLEPFEGLYPSPRGAGKLFGKDVTETVLKALNVKILIRGHEPCNDGFQINHDGRILTLFSRKGAPYYNVHGAYLDVELSGKFQNAEQLIPYVHKF
jgi:protein phosphatase